MHLESLKLTSLYELCVAVCVGEGEGEGGRGRGGGGNLKHTVMPSVRTVSYLHNCLKSQRHWINCTPVSGSSAAMATTEVARWLSGNWARV